MAAARSSCLFAAYRAVGLVCDGKQMELQALGREAFLTTSIGRAFQVYRVDHLSISLVSAQLRHHITHVTAIKDVTFAATEAGITVFKRARPVRTLAWSASQDDGSQAGQVVGLMVLGDVMLSLHDDGCIRIWDAKAAVGAAEGAAAPASSSSASSSSVAPYALMDTVKLPAGTQPTCFMHPATYVNKVVVGTEDGQLLLVNVRTGSLVHTCDLHPGTPVTALSQSPAVDVIAAGFTDGRIVVHNLRADKSVVVFQHGAGGHADAGAGAGAGAGSRGTGGAVVAVNKGAASGNARITSLCFSADTSLPFPTLVSANDSGSVALWNLTGRSLHHVLPAAHDAAVLFAGFLPGQPCLLTCGADNAMHVWAIDKLEGSPKLLRSRAGHVAPPRILRYYGGASVASLASGASATACEIASAGADRSLRMFHTALERQNCELSQGHVTARARELGVHPSTLRLPPVTALAVSDRRHAQWADVVTAHAGESRAYCWSWERKRLEDRVLVMPNSHETVTAVTISTCGNFAVCGGASGTLCLFNLQSGARRGVFPADPSVRNVLTAKGKKRGALQPGGELPAPDRDTGRGQGADHSLGIVDSVDATLAKAMGILPPQMARAAAAAQGGAAKPEPEKHRAAVYGVAVDALNSTVISADAEGKVMFWDFNTHAPVGSLQLPASASSMVLHRDSGLAAVACDDFVLRVVDVANRRLVRTFVGHTNRITDACFSPDARWLVSSGMDRSVRVWELPTGRCIDWLAFASVPVSVAFSPTSEYLVTCHADSPALYLWANKAYFSSVVIEGAPDKPTLMDLPQPEVGTSLASGGAADSKDSKDGEEETQEEEADSGRAAKRARTGDAGGDDGEEEDAAMHTGAPEGSARVSVTDITPKAEGAITLSGLPQSAWINLGRLDQIAARNKPTEAPKKPESAPFFLPTSGGTAPVFVAPTAGDNGADSGVTVSGRHIVSSGGRTARTQLATLLRPVVAAVASGDKLGAGAADAFTSVLQLLSGLGPSSIDVQVRGLCLGPEDDDGLALLRAFLLYIRHLCANKVAYDLAQAHLSLLLNVYSDVIASQAPLRRTLAAVRQAQAADGNRLTAMLDKSLCIVSTLLGQ